MIALGPGTAFGDGGVAEVYAAVPFVLAEGLPFVFENEVLILLRGLDLAVAAFDELIAILHFGFAFEDRPSFEVFSVEEGNALLLGGRKSGSEERGCEDEWEGESFFHHGTKDYANCRAI